MSSNCDYFNGTNDVKFLITNYITMSNKTHKQLLFDPNQLVHAYTFEQVEKPKDWI